MSRRRPTKRRSTSTHSSQQKKKRSKSRLPAPTKTPKAKKPAPKKRKRSPAPKKRKNAAAKKRSSAAKKGWAKRRKKQRLIKAMAEHRLRRSDQPLGWIERRSSLRSVSGGKVWEQISFEFDESAHDRERLAALSELEIDFLTRDELYDYLAWMAEEFDIDISDLYRMYLGYEVGEATAQ
jgi:hypothetical protein